MAGDARNAGGAWVEWNEVLAGNAPSLSRQLLQNAIFELNRLLSIRYFPSY